MSSQPKGKAIEAPAAYEELLRRLREKAVLSSCVSLLLWDEATYMPAGGVSARSNQLAYLAGIEHEKATDPRLGDLLGVLENSLHVEDPHSPQAVNIRETRRTFDRLTRVPRSLIEEIARTAAIAQQQWAGARRKKDFSGFRPWLEKIVALKQEEARCLGFVDEPYDAMLEEYEPGLRTAEVAGFFRQLGDALAPLLAAILATGKRPRLAILRRVYPVDRQKAFGREVAQTLGFDWNRGRLDQALHPFCSNIGPGDCRVTARYLVRNFNVGFFAILHEVGHGLYEQGLDPGHEGTPFGHAPSIALHESQSRLWENIVGRGLAFWTSFFPRAQQVFPESLGNVKLDEFHRAINHVEPSLNRVQADEVTYNLHILIRFELERALMRGDLKAADLPEAWSDAYQRHLGVTPANDAEGCLQDGHWSEGLIGYFPTYTLGNLLAAQLFSKAKSDLEQLEDDMARGDFSDLLRWLRAKVHRQGNKHPTRELIEVVSGSALDHQALVRFLRGKYEALYAL